MKKKRKKDAFFKKSYLFLTFAFKNEIFIFQKKKAYDQWKKGETPIETLLDIFLSSLEELKIAEIDGIYENLNISTPFPSINIDQNDKFLYP